MGNVPALLAAATVAFGWAANYYSSHTKSLRTATEEKAPLKILFVWDFDWTIINCNSDEYIPAQFIRNEQQLQQGFRQLYKETNGDWHACVEQMIHGTGATPTQILDAAQQMPYLTGVRSALDQIHQSAAETSQMIVSDGNTLFLRAFLEHQGILQYFSHGIITNIGSWTPEGRLRITPQSQQYGGHQCSRCPANLCKTQALTQETLHCDNHPNRTFRIVYVGDGGNDACPALHILQKEDILLARVGKRRNWANQRRGAETDDQANSNGQAVIEEGSDFGISKALQKAKDEVPPVVPKCQVREWTTGEDLRRLVDDILKET